MDSGTGIPNSNVKENIKYLINSPEELDNISNQMFETADINRTGYFTFDDVVTIFNVKPIHPPFPTP